MLSGVQTCILHVSMYLLCCRNKSTKFMFVADLIFWMDCQLVDNCRVQNEPVR